MAEIHDYDKGAWQGELNELNKAREILMNTNMPDIDGGGKLFEILDLHIQELNDLLKYGHNDDGEVDYPQGE